MFDSFCLAKCSYREPDRLKRKFKKQKEQKSMKKIGYYEIEKEFGKILECKLEHHDWDTLIFLGYIVVENCPRESISNVLKCFEHQGYLEYWKKWWQKKVSCMSFTKKPVAFLVKWPHKLQRSCKAMVTRCTSKGLGCARSVCLKVVRYSRRGQGDNSVEKKIFWLILCSTRLPISTSVDGREVHLWISIVVVIARRWVKVHLWRILNDRWIGPPFPLAVCWLSQPVSVYITKWSVAF